MSVATCGAGLAVDGGSNYAAEVLADSPDLYWRFLETSGTNADDSSPNNHDGTYSGGVTLNQAGPVSKAVKMAAASSQYVATSDTFASTIVSLECWVKIADAPTTANMAVLDRPNAPGGSTRDKSVYIAQTTGKAGFYIYDGNIKTVESASAIPFGAWVHLVGVTNGSTIKIYVNGAEAGSAAAGTSFGGTSVLCAGQTFAYEFFDDYLAEVAMYPSALSAGRIAAHYAAR